jgi:hypothetical protein
VKKILTIREIVLFAIMGAVLVSVDFALDFLPSIELVTSLIIAFSVVYRWKAIFPTVIYVVVLHMFIYGFTFWMVAFLFIYPLFCVITVLISKHISIEKGQIVYPLLSALFGLSFGTLCMPAQAIAFSLNWEQSLAWIVAGLAFDIAHMWGNFITGLLIVPIILELRRISKWTNY